MSVAELAALLRGRQPCVVLTGAGISTESGIPDFRSPGGIWSQAEPVYFDSFLRSAEARFEYWRQKSVSYGDFARAAPNAGHRVLAAWQAAGRLVAVITQNIDELHQRAGSTGVVELHGTAWWMACLDCQQRYPAEPYMQRFQDEQRVPPCANCGGRLKHATISFGQPLDEQVLNGAMQLARSADLLLAIGSSLVVHPAASLPAVAKRSSARVVIINRDPTGQDELADLVLHESIGSALSAIDQDLSELDAEQPV